MVTDRSIRECGNGSRAWQAALFGFRRCYSSHRIGNGKFSKVMKEFLRKNQPAITPTWREIRVLLQIERGNRFIDPVRPTPYPNTRENSRPPDTSLIL